MIKIAVVLEPCEEGGFSASVPTVPGCFGEGETLEQAIDNIRDAIELHLEAVEDDLIVDENSKVIELTWTFSVEAPASRLSSEVTTNPMAATEESKTPPGSEKSAHVTAAQPERVTRRKISKRLRGF